MKFTIVNKKAYDIKIKIYKNNKLQNVLKMYSESKVINIFENSDYTLLVKRTNNILLHFIKYILLHLNGVINFELSEIFQYEKITFFSGTEDVTFIYCAKETILSGVEKHGYEIKQDKIKGACISIILFLFLTVSLYILYIY